MNWIDIGLKHKFISCPDMTPMPEDMWMSGEPSNWAGEENVIGLYFTLDLMDHGYTDKGARNKLRAFCEVFIKTLFYYNDRH